MITFERLQAIADENGKLSDVDVYDAIQMSRYSIFELVFAGRLFYIGKSRGWFLIKEDATWIHHEALTWYRRTWEIESYQRIGQLAKLTREQAHAN